MIPGDEGTYEKDTAAQAVPAMANTAKIATGMDHDRRRDRDMQPPPLL
jgi:hypothetical protein